MVLRALLAALLLAAPMSPVLAQSVHVEAPGARAGDEHAGAAAVGGASFNGSFETYDFPVGVWPDGDPPAGEHPERARYIYSQLYAPFLQIGSFESYAHLKVAQHLLSRPLRGRSVLIIALSPETDAPAIAELSAAAKGATIVVLQDPARLSEEIGAAVRKYRRRPIHVVGHIENMAFALADRSGAAVATLPIADLQAMARDNVNPLILVGCNTAGPQVAIGTSDTITTDQIARGVGDALKASTALSALAWYAAQGIPFDINADALAREGRLDIVARPDPPVTDPYGEQVQTAALGYVLAPPPALYGAVLSAFPNGCDSNDLDLSMAHTDVCPDYQAVAAAPPAEDSAADEDAPGGLLRYWPWGAGGLVALFAFAALTRRR
jgi:hypothetical protein